MDNIVSLKSLEPDHYLGQGLSAGFKTLTVLVAHGLPDSTMVRLVEGQFMVAVQRMLTTSPLGRPSSAEMIRDKFYLLRVFQAGDVPETGPGAMLIDRLMSLQQDAFPDSDASLFQHHFHMVTCKILGVFTSLPENANKLHYSGDVDLFSPALNFHVYKADHKIMQILANGTLAVNNRINFGVLRFGEGMDFMKVPEPVFISMDDIRGKRTAMFGKTRMGKSNIVKLIVQGMLDCTKDKKDVGQLIFDVNGEYANTNPQDGLDAIGNAYSSRCSCYFLTERSGNVQGKLLRFNFHERPAEAFQIMKELLPPDVSQSPYVRTLLTCRLPSLVRQATETDVEMHRKMRKLMLFWTVLDSIGFPSNSKHLAALVVQNGVQFPFSPNFSQQLRMAAYQAVKNTPPPPQPNSFEGMVIEFMVLARFSQAYSNDPNLVRDGHHIFDGDEEIMISFLLPPAGVGPYVLRPCLPYHSPVVNDFISNVLECLANGETVIIDLGSANEQIIRYFAKTLSEAVFREQERKFASNQLDGAFVQIYFEEAHMIFPPNSGNVIDVYSRFAKEGAKFNIGIVYSTQSPSTINRDLLAQTENFFIGHLSSENETASLESVQFAFKGLSERILAQRTPGLVHLLTYSHRYVIPVQAHRYNGQSRLVS